MKSTAVDESLSSMNQQFCSRENQLLLLPNVYNSLQSSFLSLAWPWPGRSLPKGNQWECWDHGLGPNLVELSVHMPPQCPLHPLLDPDAPTSLMAPWHPWHLTPPNAPWCPTLLLAPQSLHSLPAPMHPWDPLHPLLPPWFSHSPYQPPIPPDVPTPLLAPQPHTPWQPPMHPWHLLHPCLSPDSPIPHTTPTSPPMPPMPITPLLALSPALPDSSPMHSWHPYILCWSPTLPHTPYWLPMPPDAPIPLPSLNPTLPASHPDTPTPLLVQTSSGQQCYYCRSAWHVISLWILYLW